MSNNTNKDKLSKIFNNDPLGLLVLDIEQSSTKSIEEQRLIDSFQEIVEFYETHSSIPNEDGDLGEFKLAKRLQAIKSDPAKVKMLLSYDLYDLLDGKITKSVTIEDILSDDPLGILMEDGGQEIYKLTHVQPSDRIRPDYIARRRICKDFAQYKEMFQKIQEDLKNKKRKLSEYRRGLLVNGGFYVLRGIMFYLEIPQLEIDQRTYVSGVYNRLDGRTRCIFDNGTESNMLFRSLEKAMRIDGVCVTELLNEVNVSNEIVDEDVQNGYIYVLRSLNTSPQIRRLKNLYKIGYSSGSVTERIKNAIHEPTYLMSDVSIVLTVRCYNMDTRYMESAIHDFFGAVNVAFEVKDKMGVIHYPREWFTAPIDAIEEAIRLIAEKKASDYRYDEAIQQIIKK